MPNVASWNGKWTGATKKYYVIRTYRGKEENGRITDLVNGKEFANFYYRWEDGWGANVRMEIVGPSDARKRKKESAGFCGYEWMIDSILKHGKIIIANHLTPGQSPGRPARIFFMAKRIVRNSPLLSKTGA
jgi:hypothetical protein